MGHELAEGVSCSPGVYQDVSANTRLPLDPVLVAISELLPKIQDSQSRAGAPSSKVLNLIKGASLVDVLPPTPPVVPRRFQVSDFEYCSSKLMTVDDRIGHLAHIAPVGRHLRCGLDVRGGLAGYDGEAIWCEDCAGAGTGRASGEGAEAVGRGLVEAGGVGRRCWRKSTRTDHA